MRSSPMKVCPEMVLCLTHPRELVFNVYLSWRRLMRVRALKLLFPTLIILYIVYKYLLGTPSQIRLPSGVDIHKYTPFEPDVTSDFPSGGVSEAIIPRILHQTWVDQTIPAKFVPNIKSFIKHNPSWEYYLWTDTSVRLLVERHFPHLVPVWDSYVYSYHHRLRRFNAARYVILFVYGGLFVDMDTINYRALDPVITKYSCILPTEPYEHTFSTFVPYTITNSVMFCKPKHPFFKFVIDNLHNYLHLSHSWDSAGPGFLTSQYKRYIHLDSPNGSIDSQGVERINSDDTRPYMYHGDIPPTHPDGIYVPNTRYFTGNSDTNLHSWILKSCSEFNHLHMSLKRVCVDLSKRGLIRKNNEFTYIQHLWQNNWYGLSNFYLYLKVYSFLFGTDIHTIVPHCKIYE